MTENTHELGEKKGYFKASTLPTIEPYPNVSSLPHQAQ